MKSVGKAYYSPPHVILAIAQAFNCELTNPETYIAKGEDAGVAATSVRRCREAFAARVPLGLAYARPNQRVEEISALPGAAPAGISGVAVDDDDDASDDTAVVKIQREQQALVARRVTAEVAEREAAARAHAATAHERELASKLLQHQLTQAERHGPLIDAKVAAETEAGQVEPVNVECACVSFCYEIKLEPSGM